MIWPTLSSVRASLREFSAKSGLRERHTLIQLASGIGWTRVLGAPGADCKHVRGNVWRQVTP